MSDSKLQALQKEFLSGSISRRQFIKRAAAVGLSVSAFGFLRDPASAQETVVLQWWDQFNPLEALHRRIWDEFQQANPNVRVDYTVLNPAEMGQALQLAFRSGQAPDVHTLAGLGVPASQLVREGWFTPLASDFNVDNPFVRESLYEGMTVFDGRIYSFPIFSPRQHTTTLWYNADMVAAAGLDPEVDLRTWEGVREAARAMTSGRTYGILLPIQFAARMGEHVQDLAEIAGAPGAIDWRTGEYAYGTQPFVDAIEFLLSFQEDGSLHPASSSLDARNGRARWAAGEAALFFDGPWNSGVLNNNFPEVIDIMGAAGIPVRALGDDAHTYNGPSEGIFWISSQSEHPEVASAILQNFTSDEYYVGLAERMDQPPLDLSAVERADVHPVYRRVIADFLDVVRIAPDPIIKNPNVAHVIAEMRSINPNLGEIVQGAFSGAIPNLQATLQNYADKLTAERQRAIQVVQDRGIEVSIEDWIFPNWQPGVDYTAEQYE